MVVDEIAMLMNTMLRELPLEDVEVKLLLPKPFKNKSYLILRAGIGMVDGLLSLVPAAKVGHIRM